MKKLKEALKAMWVRMLTFADDHPIIAIILLIVALNIGIRVPYVGILIQMVLGTTEDLM